MPKVSPGRLRPMSLRSEPRLDYRTGRGKRVHLTSPAQHRWMHARLNEGDAAGDHTHYEHGVSVARHSVATTSYKPPRRRRQEGLTEGEKITRTAVTGAVALAVVPPLITSATP